jgi:hypothetical protein
VRLQQHPPANRSGLPRNTSANRRAGTKQTRVSPLLVGTAPALSPGRKYPTVTVDGHIGPMAKHGGRRCSGSSRHVRLHERRDGRADAVRRSQAGSKVSGCAGVGLDHDARHPATRRGSRRRQRCHAKVDPGISGDVDDRSIEAMRRGAYNASTPSRDFTGANILIAVDEGRDLIAGVACSTMPARRRIAGVGAPAASGRASKACRSRTDPLPARGAPARQQQGGGSPGGTGAHHDHVVITRR